MEKYPVVIMAGGQTPEKILEAGETEKERAFIDIGGRPMLAWVLDALNKSELAGDILCFGNAERIRKTFGLREDQVMEDKGSMLENFMSGMQHFHDHHFVLSMTCDIPLLTAEALTNLMKQVATIDAEVYYPIIDVKLYDEKFPGGKRTTQALKEGTFTGGNVFVLNPESVIQNRSRVEAVIRDRKSPAKLIRLFGLPFIVKYAMKNLDLPGLEAKATQILGAKMRGVITPYPEIGFDVDKPEDLRMVRDIMGHA
jgi:GTP:adenosylcobinamide-phosphate guanylyltransferase